MDDDKYHNEGAVRGHRARERREQILDAASVCFAREGFHGASIAQISKLSGMSPGHIYHFFENKEAIVSGIVQRMATRWLELLSPYPTDEDVVETMMRRARISAESRTQRDFAGLWLEVLAETARNPRMAAAVNEADQRVREALGGQVEFIRRMSGLEPTQNTDAIVEVVFALFEGLSNRMVINQAFDLDSVFEVLLVATRAAIES
ncbi:MAG: TetR/AcrR family transcriptional regulator [Gammaproteobacteria bacterium]|nr:TetR/AcrR family transcriptional regulator [Gammaproteobacteria bacterium]